MLSKAGADQGLERLCGLMRMLCEIMAPAEAWQCHKIQMWWVRHIRADKIANWYHGVLYTFTNIEPGGRSLSADVKLKNDSRP